MIMGTADAKKKRSTGSWYVHVQMIHNSSLDINNSHVVQNKILEMRVVF